jgi:hypothetical protein
MYIKAYYFYLKIINNNLYINILVFTVWVMYCLYTTSATIMYMDEYTTPYYRGINDNYWNNRGFSPYDPNLVSTSQGYRAEMSSTPIHDGFGGSSNSSVYRFGEIDQNSSYSPRLGEYRPVRIANPSYYIHEPVAPTFYPIDVTNPELRVFDENGEYRGPATFPGQGFDHNTEHATHTVRHREPT